MVDKIKLELTQEEFNSIMNVFDVAIRSPNSNINVICKSKFALMDRFEESKCQ